ncbi:ATP-binding cassette domain-containing protein [Halostagnicola bangensis]
MATALDTDEPILRMEDVHKWYGSVHALKGVDLHVYPGEILGLLGDNGAGKSTLIEMIAGVHEPTEGDVFWKGERTEITSVRDARALNIETVFQDQAVVEDRSVAQNVFLGRELATGVGPVQLLDKERMREEAEEVTQSLGLDIASPEQEVRFCSGGEKQGVAIARAMYFDAELVIMDEPTTALAISGVRKVLDFIEQLAESGTAVIFISHNLPHAYDICDRFTVFSRGEKVGDVKKAETDVNDLENMQAGLPE